MNFIRSIERAFKAIAPAIAQYLTQPEDRAIRTGPYSISVRLKSGEFESTYPSANKDTVIETHDPNQLIFRLTKPVELPFSSRISVKFILAHSENGPFTIAMETQLTDHRFRKQYRDEILKGSIKELHVSVLESSFSSNPQKKIFTYFP